MDQGRYAEELHAILQQHSGQAIRMLRAVKGALPEQAEEVQIIVHPNQEPDGFFTVMVHLTGRDLYVLNKSIEKHRTLFSVTHSPTGPVPPVPTFDPFDTEFSVNDTLVDVAAAWVSEIWAASGPMDRSLPAQVCGADGYGSKLPRKL